MKYGQSTVDAIRTNSQDDLSEGGEDMDDIGRPWLRFLACPDGQKQYTANLRGQKLLLQEQ